MLKREFLCLLARYLISCTFERWGSFNDFITIELVNYWETLKLKDVFPIYI